MDLYELQNVLQKQSTVEKPRPPLVSAEKNINGTTTTSKSRTREVSSRFRSPAPVASSGSTSSRRYPSPTATRTATTSNVVSVQKRSVSAERKRPSAPGTPVSPPSPSPSTPVQDTSAETVTGSKKVVSNNKMPESLWPSTMRSLSVSFQSDSFSLPVNKKEKPVNPVHSDRTLRPSSNVARKQSETTSGASRKATPERKRSPLKGRNSTDQCENFRPVEGVHSRLLEQHRWPSKTGGKLSSSTTNRSIDLGDKGRKIPSLPHSGGSGVPSSRRWSLDGMTGPLQKSASDLLALVAAEKGGKKSSVDDNSLEVHKPVSSTMKDRIRLINPAVRSQSSTLHGSRPASPKSASVSSSLDGMMNPLRKSASDLLALVASDKGGKKSSVDDDSLELHKTVSSSTTLDRIRLMNPAVRSQSLTLHGSRPASPSRASVSSSSDGMTSPLQKSASDLLALVASDKGGKQSSVDDNSLELHKPVSSTMLDRVRLMNPAVRSQSLTLHGAHPASPSRASISSSSVSRGASPSRIRTASIVPSRGPSPSRSMPSSPLKQSASTVPMASRSRPSSPSRQSASTVPALWSRPSSPSRQSANTVPALWSRPSSPSRQSASTVPTSVLSFIADIKIGKKTANHLDDAHHLRILYNRHLQWRFANAQADVALQCQLENTELTLNGVWRTISDLRDSVIERRIELQQLMLKMKLFRVLNHQQAYLDEWSTIEADHADSLSQTLKDLQTSTLRLPVAGGARGNIKSLKEAVCSAVDIMQAMGSSLCFVLKRVGEINRLTSELAAMTSHERAMLDECEALLTSTVAMQAVEHSLRANLIQMKEARRNRHSIFGD